MANNLIYNDKGVEQVIIAHDSLDGIDFESNIVNNQGVSFDKISSIEAADFSISELEENVWIPSADLSSPELYNGFEFDLIKKESFWEFKRGKK
ncbi:chondroitinase-B domain-containing protein [Zobellia nedashkovskayae]